MRHRGFAYPFPLAYCVLDWWSGEKPGLAGLTLTWWNEERGALYGIPSIFA